MVDSTVPLPADNDGKEVKCLNWWTQVSSRYPTIFKLITVVLSIFHGSQIEITFSKIDHVLDDKSGNMDVQTLDSTETVKYWLSVNQL